MKTPRKIHLIKKSPLSLIQKNPSSHSKLNYARWGWIMILFSWNASHPLPIETWTKTRKIKIILKGKNKKLQCIWCICQKSQIKRCWKGIWGHWCRGEVNTTNRNRQMLTGLTPRNKGSYSTRSKTKFSGSTDCLCWVFLWCWGIAADNSKVSSHSKMGFWNWVRWDSEIE
jgi:hypothetical protein